jgi:ParB/RepB/Spo0J family partition protein
MPLSSQYQDLALDSIQVIRDTRQRRVVATEGLRQSIAQVGVLNPVIVRQDPERGLVLVAGERRLQACRELGLATIPARFASSLSPIEAQIIELEENLKREDLEWQDQVQALARIHGLYQALDPDWTMGETAQALSLSLAKVSQDLRVAGEMAAGNQRVAQAATSREALNVILRVDARTAGDALQELLEAGEEVVPAPGQGAVLPFPEPRPQAFTPEQLQDRSVPAPQAGPPPAEACILHTKFEDWLASYTGPKFNLVHCDFPYGIEAFAGPQGRGSEPGSPVDAAHGPEGAKKWKVGYQDENEVYWGLIQAFCRGLDKFMSVSAHLMFWCSADSQRVAKTLGMFAQLAPSLEFHRFPLIWVKSDNAGIVSDYRHGPRHTYEFCLFASRGKRQILRVASDAYQAPTDKRYHVSTKPEPMLRHFMAMTCDERTSLFDPTCGSGAALRAAESLGARRVLGLECDEEACRVARQVLKNSRLLRSASGG